MDRTKNIGIPNKWLYFPIISLLVYLVIRFFDQSRIIRYFPLDQVNDIASYMAQLFFLTRCGFLELCPYWYNGFITFQFTPPGWFFFSLPLYLITGDVLFTSFLMLTLSYVFSFLSFYFWGKIFRFSGIKRIAFFLFFLANAVAIGNFVRLGRLHELLAWLFFINFAFLILWYKNNRFDGKSLFLPFLFGFIILTHQTVAVLSSVLILSLFLVKKGKEKFILVGLAILGFLVSSFWSVQYIMSFNNAWASSLVKTKTLFDFSQKVLFENLVTIMIPIVLWIIFYYYWVSRNKSKSELLFFLPIFILSFLLISRLVYFVPIFKHVFPDSYNLFFLFFILFYLFKTDYKVFNPLVKKLLLLGLVLLPIMSIGANIFLTPQFTIPGELERDTLSVISKVENKFFIVRTPSENSYPMAYYSYASIYYNLSSPLGFHKEVVSKEYRDRINTAGDFLDFKDCEGFVSLLDEYQVYEVISYNDDCKIFEQCDFTERFRKNDVCLYDLDP